ncbi:MAG: hypothetical protein U0R78_19500, partial [Nocardioidaceae bacterium]
VGNFTSIAGGGTPGCHQCSAPPLGTQGFLWGLVFMTGFVGATLMLLFLGIQTVINARRRTPLALLASTVLVSSVFYFLFYDALDLPMLVTMMTIGLSSREHVPLPGATTDGRPVRASVRPALPVLDLAPLPAAATMGDEVLVADDLGEPAEEPS